jgi:hypothetical protein
MDGRIGLRAVDPINNWQACLRVCACRLGTTGHQMRNASVTALLILDQHRRVCACVRVRMEQRSRGDGRFQPSI